MLLHEGLGALALWRDFPERLARATGRRTIVWSRHGYGRSAPAATPRPQRYMHHEALVVLPELLAELGVERPVLVGHSDGASIALVSAGTRPAAAIVAISPHVFVEDRALSEIAAARERYASSDLPVRMARYHDDPDTTFYGWNDVWLSDGFRDWTIEEYLPAISAPILLVQSADDEYGTLEQFRRIEAAVRGPTNRLVLPDGGHAPHLSRPAAVLAGVAGFLRSPTIA